MPLSDREKRLLAEMEEALVADDPRLVSALSGTPRAVGTSILRGLILVFLGLAVLLGGLIAKATIIGVAGFILALAGLLIAIRAIGAPNASKSAKAPKVKGGLGTRLENRWDQRNQG